MWVIQSQVGVTTREPTPCQDRSRHGDRLCYASLTLFFLIHAEGNGYAVLIIPSLWAIDNLRSVRSGIPIFSARAKTWYNAC
jgi:hypothetical protein